MPKTAIHKHKGTHPDRRNSAKRSRKQATLSERRLHGGKRGRDTGDQPITNVEPHFLNPAVEAVKVFYCTDKSIFDNTTASPNKIPAALVRLYKTLKRMPKFKDDKQWKELPSLAQLADYLFEEAAKQFGKEEKWTFGYDEKGNVRFYHYKELDQYMSNFMLPLEWLPELKAHKESIYDLVVCVVGMVGYKWDLNIIRHGYNEFILDDIESYYNGDPDDDAKLQSAADVYEKGAAHDFGIELRNTSKKYSVAELSSKINSTRFNGPLMKRIKKWLLLGIESLKNPAEIHEYFFRDEEVHSDGDPINAKDYMCMVWSFHDYMHEMSEDYINNSENEFGAIGPIIKTEHFPNKAPKAPAGEQISSLAKFLDAGRGIYFSKFIKHYERLHSDTDYKFGKHTLLPKPFKTRPKTLNEILR
jgi:hypothetical protein